MKKILITGANGFVGSNLVDYLLEKGYNITATVRKLEPSLDLESANLHWIETGEISPDTDWSKSLEGVVVVIHLAQRAHVMHESDINPEKNYQRINVDAMNTLLQQSAKIGVKKFIFLSSVKVNGEKTIKKPFTENDKPCPEDPYARSKLNAENLIRNIAKESGLKYTIIRPPLIYGFQSPGNFKLLIKLIKSGLPLPLGAVHNKRSLVGLNNLCDLIETCIRKKEAENETFLVSDDHDLSTTELISELSRVMRKSQMNIPFPPFLIKASLNMMGKSAIADRLLGSLQVDITKAKKVLGWIPPNTPDFDLKNAVKL